MNEWMKYSLKTYFWNFITDNYINKLLGLTQIN